MIRHIDFSSYTPVGDLTVVAICLVMMNLIFFSYINKTRSFRIFLSIIGFLVVSACADVSFYSVVKSGENLFFARLLRCVFHAALYLTFLHFVLYIISVTKLERPRKQIYIGVSVLLLVLVMVIDAFTSLSESRLAITETGIDYEGNNIFFYAYFAFVAIIILLLVRVRNRVYKRVMRGFYGSIAISFLMLLLQGLFDQVSYTVVTFLFPVIAMLYIMHSNPYDALIGAIDSSALGSMVRYNYEKQREFVFMSLFLRQFHEEGKLFPDDMQAAIRRFSSDFFKGALLFQVDNGHEMLVFSPDRNPDYEQRIERILSAFQEVYRKFRYDYKIVIGVSIPEISRKNEYVSFIQNVHRSMPENSIHRIGQEDVERFNKFELVMKEMESIHTANDLNDPRVLVYCQPVLNIRTMRYDTAEALMRLRLEGRGIVGPDEFIPLAEANGYIHTLTRIILHKTCGIVRRMEQEGYRFDRVSVNVSALELKDENFCRDVIRIISDCGVPGDKIAIELTESRSDSDFLVMKNKISELRARGIKIYLDDFGTGYSNMERIMQLPFDIIKFDRSLVVASESSERSEKIVENLANMFSELDYSVLYEGVENEHDEALCKEMFASYLQGYKYSRPVPIEQLTEYFMKNPA